MCYYRLILWGLFLRPIIHNIRVRHFWGEKKKGGLEKNSNIITSYLDVAESSLIWSGENFEPHCSISVLPMEIEGNGLWIGGNWLIN